VSVGRRASSVQNANGAANGDSKAGCLPESLDGAGVDEDVLVKAAALYYELLLELGKSDEAKKLVDEFAESKKKNEETALSNTQLLLREG
jgi:hypothetical protein